MPASFGGSTARFGTLVLTLALASCAGASGPSTPPPTTPDDLVRIHGAMRVPGLEDRRFDHATYWAAVQPYLADPWRMEVAGHSAEGREIRHLTVGSGPVRVLLWSQMHGNESTASMTLADVIRFFRDWPDHPLARRITEGATVHLVPMLNPDGAQRFQRRNAQGIDVNRDARRLQTPEGRTLKAVRDAVEPEFGFNLHDQNPNTRVGDTDRRAAIALLAPAFNEPRDVDAKRYRAMQVASLLVEAMEPLVGDHISKYDDTFNPRAFGDLMGAWGASTVLIESGGWADDPQKQHLRRTNFVGILTALDAIATGRYATYGSDRYENLLYNASSRPDLLVLGGTVAVPGLPPLRADLRIDYDQPLLHEGGVISDIGDLGGMQAYDTLDVSGLFVIPTGRALGAGGGLDTGAPAWFVVADDAEGRRIRYRFEGGPPRD